LMPRWLTPHSPPRRRSRGRRSKGGGSTWSWGSRSRCAAARGVGVRLGMEGWFRWLAFVLVLPVSSSVAPGFTRAPGASSGRAAPTWTSWWAGFNNRLRLQRVCLVRRLAHPSLLHGSGGHPDVDQPGPLARGAGQQPGGGCGEESVEPGTGHRPPAHRHGRGVRSAGGQSGGERPGPAQAGDRVPTDAMVVEGQSAVDESMLTGESLPVDKAAGPRCSPAP